MLGRSPYRGNKRMRSMLPPAPAPDRPGVLGAGHCEGPGQLAASGQRDSSSESSRIQLETGRSANGSSPGFL